MDRAHGRVRPRGRRSARVRRGLLALALLVSGVAASSSAPAPAGAGPLDDRQERLERRIERAHDHLEESTGRARRASIALLRARENLGQARGRLARARGELAVAEALDRRLQAQLDQAVARLGAARRELSAGRAEVREQEGELRGLVAGAYEQGDPDLLGLSTVLTTQDPAQLAGRLSAGDDVVNLQASILDRLEATKVVLAVQKEETRAVKEEVATRRAEAAENLERIRTLAAQAEAAAQQVELLVGARAKARAEAVDAKEADRRALRELEAERSRVEAMIRARTQQTDYSGGPVDGGGSLAMPVAGYVTSPFGWRTHPIWGYRSLHDGVDFGAACGTPIVAAESGTVLSTYFSSSWGNRVIVDHGILKGVGVSTISNHLSSFAVSAGQRVRRGQVIGYVGSTGWSTGCHLHFTLTQNGSPVDPMTWL